MSELQREIQKLKDTLDKLDKAIEKLGRQLDA